MVTGVATPHATIESQLVDSEDLPAVVSIDASAGFPRSTGQRAEQRASGSPNAVGHDVIGESISAVNKCDGHSDSIPRTKVEPEQVFARLIESAICSEVSAGVIDAIAKISNAPR